jgi:E3 ubiquitin-protein ligase HUWE1
VLYQYQNAVASFEGARGLDALVARIKEEVEGCVTLKLSTMEDSSLEGNKADNEIPFEKASFLRALLKFILHMMQTTGSLDQMRNLIETTLPNSLLTIFNHSAFFGTGIFGLGKFKHACVLSPL